ncbi:hypothetical protein B0H21DRAFT_138019 [Amylocystis lapponica]|nr:hypothetical protein B0H21DRAFT_138019 [Amylocystis lapponica]
MAPFASPGIVLSGFKERAESLTVQGNRFYIGTATGNLHVYAYDESNESEQPATLVETRKGLSRRAIDQLGFVKDVNSLVVLSESLVTLYPLPTFAPPTPLTKTKGALSFASFTGVAYSDPEQSTDGDFVKAKAVPAVVTYLAVGCKRKMVIYSWKDGEPQEVQEAVLPHSPRAMVFLSLDDICFGYSPTEYAMFSLKTSITTELANPVSPTTSGAGIGSMGMGALSGLGGYMSLGLGVKAKPCVVAINEKEALVAKDNSGIFVGEEGKQTRSINIDWPAPPEDLGFVKPYVFSVMPAGSVPISQLDSSSGSSTSTTTFIPSPVLEIRSSISLQSVQTHPFPPTIVGSQPVVNHTVRLLTASPSAKSPLFLVTTPTDRATATTTGSSIWQFRMKPWSKQIDELVEEGSYADALALLDSIDSAVLTDKDSRVRRVRALHAVSQFRVAHFDDAINTFLDLDINPAKVVALYPESLAGRLSVPQDEWIHLFGGTAKPPPASPPGEDVKGERQDASTSAGTPPRAPSPIRAVPRTVLDNVITATTNDDDSASIAPSVSGRARGKRKDNFHLSVETLMRYLSDRRPKVRGALEALGITSEQAHRMPFLSATAAEELFRLPDAPLSALTPEQLVHFAQIVDTVLFKSYLLVRPTLLAPLCRLGNWCEVSEVEEVLRAREKFSELILLYNGKKMHDKALDLLRQLSDKETDIRDKLMPSVTYLQRLGPEHLDQIFEHSRWIFEQDADIAFEVFTSEEVELPRQAVAEFLEKIDPVICARYLEHLIDERGEETQSFHDRLAELYLRLTITAQRQGDEELRKNAYTKLLHFLDATHQYSTDRLFGLLPSDDLFEAKAILLGRLGRHDSALEIYVYRLHDFLTAEEYCKRVYKPGTETRNVFITLLRTYLRPSAQAAAPADLLAPALALISRHGPRLDAAETLQLLPPLVAAHDVRAFLFAALRTPIFDTRVVREVAHARDAQAAQRLMQLQSRRVKVTDSRICPQCHKRIGYSVIAVHAPRGEVTHYQCREVFSRKLKETRV